MNLLSTNMTTYKVRFEEVLVKYIDIIADTPEDAREIAKEHYRNAEDDFILTSDDFNGESFISVEDVDYNTLLGKDYL